MLNVSKITSDTAFTLKVAHLPPALPADLESEIERLWGAEQAKRGNALFNGRIMSATTVSHDGITCFIAEYRHLTAQRARPELFDALRVRPVAVSGLLECADGVVFGRRSRATTQDAGLWELAPSGGMDTSGIVDRDNVDYVSQLMVELDEEIGIQSDTIYNVSPFCLIDDTESHVIDIGIAIKSSLSGNYILKAHQDSGAREYDELRIIPLSEINDFIERESSTMVSVSSELIRLLPLSSSTLATLVMDTSLWNTLWT